jgi:hypothetical protein
MPRPEERERVDPVRMLRLDGVLPVTELPVVTPLLALGALDTGAALGAGAMPHVSQ